MTVFFCFCFCFRNFEGLIKASGPRKSAEMTSKFNFYIFKTSRFGPGRQRKSEVQEALHLHWVQKGAKASHRVVFEVIGTRQEQHSVGPLVENPGVQFRGQLRDWSKTQDLMEFDNDFLNFHEIRGKFRFAHTATKRRLDVSMQRSYIFKNFYEILENFKTILKIAWRRPVRIKRCPGRAGQRLGRAQRLLKFNEIRL